MVLATELGDLRRFDNPRQLMGYLGLVPSEHSSGGRRRLGSITKAVAREMVGFLWAVLHDLDFAELQGPEVTHAA